MDDCLDYSAFSEDQAVAAYLAAAANVDDRLERNDPVSEYTALVFHSVGYAIDGLLANCEVKQAAILRCIFNPFCQALLDQRWLTQNVKALAHGIYTDRAFDRLPILADALQDAGCDDSDVLNHCRGDGPHARGCRVVDLLLGKE
ncbi:hypothetical protein [Fimbriiglobus ruber]|uniref:hypothetical protein n=1 Tax=Fimbriiglobus ruber TaxID=1908690 RepID=UPI001EE76C1C|nr:hypothetical protein [Fimbriiglobus ruber]